MKTFDHIKLVIFDLDGTLIQTHPTSQENLIKYLGELNVDIQEENRKRAIRWAHAYWANNQQVRAEYRELSRDGFWKQYTFNFLTHLISDTKMLTEISDSFAMRLIEEDKPETSLIQGVRELLWELKEKKYTLGLLSNRNNPLTGVSLEFGILQYFKFTLSAGQVNCWKPDPQVFQVALNLANGFSSEESLYVGDNYYADVIGAQRANITNVLVDTYNIYDDGENYTRIRRIGDLKKKL